MEITLFTQIQAVVDTAKDYSDLNKVNKTEKLVHKDTGEVLPELSAIEMLKQGIDVTQYNLETVTTNPRQDLIFALTGEKEAMLTAAQKEVFSDLLKLAEKLCTKAKSPFQLAMNALNAKKTKAKDDPVELTKVKTEIAQLMVERFNEKKIKPKTTTDSETLEIYERLIKQQSK